MKQKKKKGPCWKGYETVGMKMKGGRKVPNCVPVSESVDRIFEELNLINEKKIKRATRVANALYNQRKKAEGTSAESAARQAHLAQLNKLQAAKKESAGRKAARVEDSIDRIGDLVTEVAAWQRKEGKNPSGGLNKKGVESYRRENPGSKLKTAVTTKPSKLKKGSKAANRRKSFCARMGGMKKSRTSAKTANDPDSRINKALRKWNC
jgi:hypothetical protein